MSHQINSSAIFSTNNPYDLLCKSSIDSVLAEYNKYGCNADLLESTSEKMDAAVKACFNTLERHHSEAEATTLKLKNWYTDWKKSSLSLKAFILFYNLAIEKSCEKILKQYLPEARKKLTEQEYSSDLKIFDDLITVLSNILIKLRVYDEKEACNDPKLEIVQTLNNYTANNIPYILMRFNRLIELVLNQQRKNEPLWIIDLSEIIKNLDFITVYCNKLNYKIDQWLKLEVKHVSSINKEISKRSSISIGLDKEDSISDKYF
ncbi:MAG: hypothetical protein K0S74_1171 [Chlamydiales bacterium]|jgi:hypothetical protein|nr:hypothetical protein [Chlamydiales bacterium]